MRIVVAAAFVVLGLVQSLGADLVGHGGPVRAIAVLPGGQGAITAGFDSAIIRWSLARGRAVEVLRFHLGSVNALALLPENRFASAGEDGRIALWRIGETAPERVLEGHGGPVSALALSPDGRSLASAAWDGTARIWPLAGGAAQILADHKANVNGVAFLADGVAVSGDYDGRIRIFSNPVVTRQIETTIGTLGVAGDEIIAGGGDGTLRFLNRAGDVTATLAVAPMPLTALAVSPDGARLAVAGFRGTLAIVDVRGRRIERKLEGPAFPVWSLAFSADGKELFTGGANRIVRRWSVASGEALSPVEAGVADVVPAELRTHPGAAVFRACSACHALIDEPRTGSAAGQNLAGQNLAGPSLAGVLGRRIATAPGYDFSPGLKALDIVWTEETIQKLFEIGPAAYTPGTKMPEQRIIRPEDRQALTDFLKAVQKR